MIVQLKGDHKAVLAISRSITNMCKKLGVQIEEVEEKEEEPTKDNTKDETIKTPKGKTKGAKKKSV